MNTSVRVRLMTRSDLDFADSLRAAAGWNQTRADWERFLATEPAGCFLAECDGQPAGTATTTVYSDELAWIGMMLVHPDCRRRGVGQALLERCLHSLRDRRIRCIKLDATPLGQPLYEKSGFRAEWSLARWEGTTPRGPSAPRAEGVVLRPWSASDFNALIALDEEAFGVSRWRVLWSLSQASHRALVHQSPRGEITGFGMIRAGSRAAYLGPVVANSLAAATALVSALLAEAPTARVFWDVPDQNKGAVALAQQLGFGLQRPLVRMFVGENSRPGDPQKQFALAGPEVG
ncbi:MAG: GNAT family N-acetyltransferase [Verrucomicrobia bacterium]|nr:GNAT family N-acetyltransferase [Verrucomicrobiota bacterium]